MNRSIKHCCILLSLLFVPFAAPAQQRDKSASEKLHALLKREWQWTLRTNPTFASELGDLRWNDKWPDVSLQAFEQRHQHRKDVLKELDGIDSVLIAYNYHPLNVTAREHIIPVATAKGVAVVVAGVFTFVNSLPAGWRTEGTYFGRDADRQLAALQQLQQASGLPMAELALRFVIADQRISTILVGAREPAEIEQNVVSFLRGALPPDLHAAVEAVAAQFTLSTP